MSLIPFDRERKRKERSMAARAGITRADVIAEAVAMLDETADPAAVSLGAIARRLGIRPQSLYAHVDGADGLARAMAVAGLDALGDGVVPAAVGKSGTDAVAAIVRAHLDFAIARPGLYIAAIHPPGDDSALHTAIAAVNAPLEIVLSTLGLDHLDQVHWTRLFLSAVYGYVVLLRSGRMALPVDTDETADRLVTMLVSQLHSRSVV